MTTIKNGVTGYVQPNDAGLASEPRAVGRRIGKLLRAAHGHVTMSGRNNQTETRTVYQYGVEIGTVEPHSTARGTLWKAKDLLGLNHGEWWLTDWYAADALTRAPRQIK